jgi:hypothetical protein
VARKPDFTAHSGVFHKTSLSKKGTRHAGRYVAKIWTKYAQQTVYYTGMYVKLKNGLLPKEGKAANSCVQYKNVKI